MVQNRSNQISQAVVLLGDQWQQLILRGLKLLICHFQVVFRYQPNPFQTGKQRGLNLEGVKYIRFR